MEYNDKFIVDTIMNSRNRFPKNAKLSHVEMMVVFLKGNQPLLKACFKYMVSRTPYISICPLYNGSKLRKNGIIDFEFIYLSFEEPVTGYFYGIVNSIKIKNPYYKECSGGIPDYHYTSNGFFIYSELLQKSIDDVEQIMMSPTPYPISYGLLSNVKQALINRTKLDVINNAKIQLNNKFMPMYEFDSGNEWFYYIYLAMICGTNFERYSIINEFFPKWKNDFVPSAEWVSIEPKMSYSPVSPNEMSTKITLVEQLVNKIFIEREVKDKEIIIKQIKFLNSDYVFLSEGMSYIDSKQNEMYHDNQKQLMKFDSAPQGYYYLVRINKKVYFISLIIFGILSCHYKIEIIAACKLLPFIIDYGILLINEKTTNEERLINKFIITITEDING